MRKRVGFILNNEFYSLRGYGHDHLAKELICRFGWTKEFDNFQTSDPKDFLIFKKGAIQIGSSGMADQIIYSSLKHSRRDIEEVQERFDLYVYKLIAY